MILLGIDPCKYGFDMAGLMDDTVGQNELHLWSSRPYRDDKMVLPSASLGHISAVVQDLMLQISHDNQDDEIVVFCEEPVSAGARNLRTYGQLAMTVGTIIASCAKFTNRVYLVPVSKWKSVVVGKGNATKQDVALWLNRVHPIYAAQCDGRQDLIDACCIALYGIQIVSDSLLVSNWDGPGEAV